MMFFSPRNFVRLIGGALVTPRRTFGEVISGAPGGISEVLWLLGLQLVALQLPELVRAGWFMAEVDPRGGASQLLQVVSQPLMLPLLAALGGSVLLGWFGKGAGEEGRSLDLAALALVPYLILQLLGALAWRLLAMVGLNPLQVQAGVLLLGGGWFLVLFVLALSMLRASTASDAAASSTEQAVDYPRARTLAGGGAAALLLLILAFNTLVTLVDPSPLRPVSRGSTPPAFSLPGLDGASVSLADHKGEVLLLSFWASWCSPCMREMPFLSKLQQDLGARGFRVLAINVEGNKELVRGVLGRNKDKPGLRDLRVLVDSGAVAARFGVRTLPHLVLLDREGRVSRVQVGSGGEAKILRTCRALLDKEPPGGSNQGAARDAVR